MLSSNVLACPPLMTQQQQKRTRADEPCKSATSTSRCLSRSVRLSVACPLEPRRDLLWKYVAQQPDSLVCEASRRSATGHARALARCLVARARHRAAWPSSLVRVERSVSAKGDVVLAITYRPHREAIVAGVSHDTVFDQYVRMLQPPDASRVSVG
jgi:hypothetical protein